MDQSKIFMKELVRTFLFLFAGVILVYTFYRSVGHLSNKISFQKTQLMMNDAAFRYPIIFLGKIAPKELKRNLNRSPASTENSGLMVIDDEDHLKKVVPDAVILTEDQAMEKAKGDVERLKIEKQSLEEQVQRKDKELLEIQERKKQMEERLSFLEKNKATDQQRITELQNLKDKVGQLQKNLEEKSLQVSNLQKEKSLQETNLEKLKNERDQLFSVKKDGALIQEKDLQIEELTKKISSVNNQLTLFESEKKALVVRLQDSESQLQKNQQTSSIMISSLNEDIIQLKAQLEREMKEREQLSAQNERLESNLAEKMNMLKKKDDPIVIKTDAVKTVVEDKDKKEMKAEVVSKQKPEQNKSKKEDDKNCIPRKNEKAVNTENIKDILKPIKTKVVKKFRLIDEDGNISEIEDHPGLLTSSRTKLRKDRDEYFFDEEGDEMSFDMDRGERSRLPMMQPSSPFDSQSYSQYQEYREFQKFMQQMQFYDYWKSKNGPTQPSIQQPTYSSFIDYGNQVRLPYGGQLTPGLTIPDLGQRPQQLLLGGPSGGPSLFPQQQQFGYPSQMGGPQGGGQLQQYYQQRLMPQQGPSESFAW